MHSVEMMDNKSGRTTDLINQPITSNVESDYSKTFALHAEDSSLHIKRNFNTSNDEEDTAICFEPEIDTFAVRSFTYRKSKC